jgi:hypothetical protein
VRLIQLQKLIKNQGIKKKTGNEIFPNINLVSNICQLIVYLTVGTVDGQIKLGQKKQSHKSKFTNLHRLITALSQIC